MFGLCIIDTAITEYWTPKTLSPNSDNIESSTKLQIRNFFVDCLMNKAFVLNEVLTNFVLNMIVTLMINDFSNEGTFWISFFNENIATKEKNPTVIQLFKLFSDKLQPTKDSIYHKTKLDIQQYFSSRPQIISQIVNVLKDENQSNQIDILAIDLLKSIVQWVPFSAMSLDLIEILINYSQKKHNDIALEANKCLFEFFSRTDTLSDFTDDFYIPFLRDVFTFFDTEFSLIGTDQVTDEYVKSLVRTFLPFASNYFFKQDSYYETLVTDFLSKYEKITWRLYEAPYFPKVLKSWYKLCLNPISKKYKIYFQTLIDNLINILINPRKQLNCMIEVNSKFNQKVEIIFSIISLDFCPNTFNMPMYNAISKAVELY